MDSLKGSGLEGVGGVNYCKLYGLVNWAVQELNTFGLSMRIIRICRDPKKDQSLREMKKQIIDSGHQHI